MAERRITTFPLYRTSAYGQDIYPTAHRRCDCFNQLHPYPLGWSSALCRDRLLQAVYQHVGSDPISRFSKWDIGPLLPAFSMAIHIGRFFPCSPPDHLDCITSDDHHRQFHLSGRNPSAVCRSFFRHLLERIPQKVNNASFLFSRTWHVFHRFI